MPIRKTPEASPKSPTTEQPPTYPFGDDEVVVCVDSFASDLPEPNTLVKRGERLLASDDIVKCHPQRFIRDGERMPPVGPSADAVVAQVPRPPRLVSEMSDDELAECIKKLVVPSAGGTFAGPSALAAMTIIEVGEKLPLNHDLVVKHPGYWKRLG
jgi:hypothetical protein